MSRRPRRFALLRALTCVGVGLTGAATAAQATEEKMHPALADRANATPESPTALIVAFESAPGDDDRRWLAELGGTAIRSLESVPGYAVTLPAAAASAAAEASGVQYVTLDAEVRSSVRREGPLAAEETGLESLSVLAGGSGVTVALLDSGVSDHGDVADRLLASMDFTAGRQQAQAPGDALGHGTQLAGIIAGNGSASDGRVAGLAPQAGLVSLRVLDARGVGRTSDVIRAIDWAIEHRDAYGIRVLNVALGRPIVERAELDPLVRSVDHAWNAGLVVICAAGAVEDDGYFTIQSPANSRHALAVGSSTDGDTFTARSAAPFTISAGPADSLNAVASSTDGDTYAARQPGSYGTLTPGAGTVHSVGSSTDVDTARGSWVGDDSARGPSLLDHVSKPDLVAPGLHVAAPGHDTDYVLTGGTGAATALVSAAVALMLERDPDLGPDAVKARLLSTADPAVDSDPLRRGAGQLQVAAALTSSMLASDATASTVKRSDRCCDLSGVSDPLWSDALLWSAPEWDQTRVESFPSVGSTEILP